MSFKIRFKLLKSDKDDFYFTFFGLQFHKFENFYWDIQFWLLCLHIELIYFTKKWKGLLKKEDKK